jgi:hypothetical protein
VGGHFGAAGSSEAYHIAKWDGNKWSSIGIGVGGVPGASVYALAKSGYFLYVGGFFSVVGDEDNYALPANSIARFNLQTERWESIGKGIEYEYEVPGIVRDIYAREDTIYVGGEFQLADGQSYKNIAVLVDNKWSGIDKSDNISVDGVVYAVNIINDEIIIGGQLRLGTDIHYISLAKWEKDKWVEFEGSPSSKTDLNLITELIPYQSGFIALGSFDNAGSIDTDNISYFNGKEWTLFIGKDVPISQSAVVFEDKIFLGGWFEIAGGIPSVSFASYNLNITDIALIGNSIPGKYVLNQNFPNPFNPSTTINYSTPKQSKVTLKVFDVLGSEVATLLNKEQPEGNYEIKFNGSEFTSGTYFYRFQADDFVDVKKMILLK